ncbi:MULTISPECIES: DEAD/DEAH box helicase family protein [Methylobacterium]|uniref:DEAD/DEAH box helicase family protein n=1 Tax=Methylobacterium TaxID=407 RepID=UPI0006FD3A4E|nr:MULTISPECIES: DEAD/DEAH box helicase family protein [unclassified Methylobacterium]KQO66649.1 DEAD/DEAH box helicase [Methylobacterium sp. Leaf89]
MVDFKKRLGGKGAVKATNPVEIYDRLDRAHDKGPLRPAQEAVLGEWFKDHQATRDIIVKLHTGQGKTLVGLLMLQSRLNAGHGPVVYLCPDHFLIDQTCEQARQFGIRVCKAEDALPDEFINSGAILVTSVQKLFNGMTKFGLHRQSIGVDTVLMDDAHACADRIREACHIRIPNDEPAYATLRTLFADDLERQGVGTFADIENGKRDAILPVPYWAWQDREREVAGILSANAERRSIKFAWPLLKDILGHCQCVVSGAAIEIEPYVAPLNAFGSYWDAKHRIFMSATVTDDAFLVKGLQLKPGTIARPLTYDKETWSGEKMVLLPSLFNETLDREWVVKAFGEPDAKRPYGVVALVPSFARTKDWAGYGSKVADKTSLGTIVDDLRRREFEQTVVLANRYDGIDLPDETCRILVFDSRPYSESLIDLHEEHCRPRSEATLMRTLRSVEQGMGRSVRGEKDYSVIVVTGADLVRLLREKASRHHLSPQVSTQIEIGLEIAELAREEIENESKSPEDAFGGLVRQCIRRDEGWKQFYAEEMAGVTPGRANAKVLGVYAAELAAEQAYVDGDYARASETIQALLDDGSVGEDDKGWYLQERARYEHQSRRADAQVLQVSAHRKNRLLLKPPTGVTVSKLTIVSQGRMERIADWVRGFGSYVEMDVTVSDILGRLVFGTKADNFEKALDELSRALGFAGERPDKEWKEGPDNLWALDDRRYLLIECKSEVDVARTEIDKREADQMNRSSTWFKKHYEGMSATRFIIHPAGKIQSAAGFNDHVEGVRVNELRRLVKACRGFFKSFEAQDFADLSVRQIQKSIDAHKLSADDLSISYSVKLKSLK